MPSGRAATFVKTERLSISFLLWLLPGIVLNASKAG